MKGDNDNANDNKEVAKKIAVLRREKALLLGYPSHAAFVLEENMAKTPETVNAFLKQLWDPTLIKSREEAAALQTLIDRAGGGFKLASWDWWLYTEKLRQEKYALDDAALRPYFKLENVRQGIFTLCDKLYGLKFIEPPRPAPLPSRGPGFRGPGGRRPASGRSLPRLSPPGQQAGRRWSGGFRRASTKPASACRPFPRSSATSPGPPPTRPPFFRPTKWKPSSTSSDTPWRRCFRRAVTARAPSRETPSNCRLKSWTFGVEPELLALYAKHYKTGEVDPGGTRGEARKEQPL